MILTVQHDSHSSLCDSTFWGAYYFPKCGKNMKKLRVSVLQILKGIVTLLFMNNWCHQEYSKYGAYNVNMKSCT